MDVKFNSKDDLKDWMRSQGVEEAKAGDAAEILFHAGFDNSATLVGITSQQLQESGLRVPLAVYLSNILPSSQKLREQEARLKPVAEAEAKGEEETRIKAEVEARIKAEQQHINRSKSVYVLYESTEKGPDPIATAFAVSGSLLITAAHNVIVRQDVDGDVDVKHIDDTKEDRRQNVDEVVANLMISPVLQKSSNGTVTATDARAVTLANYHYHHDWAFLKVCNGELDDFIPLATTPDELPSRGTSEKMHIYHCPVRIFQDTRRATSVHSMPKEVSVGTVDERFLSFQNGGFRGSCGGPYIFRNKVVALHVESRNEAVDFEMLEEETQEGRKRKMSKIEKVLEVAESTATSHTSLGTGLILQVRSGLMKVYNGGIDQEAKHSLKKAV